jgi:hypothetical protein
MKDESAAVRELIISRQHFLHPSSFILHPFEFIPALCTNRRARARV